MKAYILVIDDDALVRQALTQILESNGYEVQCAPDGRKGLQSFRGRRPDLVISDIIMPMMEGIETIMALRILSRACPIIAISGDGRFGGIDFLAVAKELGATATLGKPFEAGDLLQAVANCLAGNFAGPALSSRPPEIAA
ncbi:MAG: regulator [Rhodospirillales bacterium]|jgi:CheY-like chemotaxis protein|nr:regulator [Rhodospirillales bacterium]